MLGIKSAQLETNRGDRLHSGTTIKGDDLDNNHNKLKKQKDLVIRDLTLVGEDLKKVRSSFQASR